MHPVCNKALSKNAKQKFTLFPEYKELCLGQIQNNTLSTTLHISKHGVATSCYRYACHQQGLRIFFKYMEYS